MRKRKPRVYTRSEILGISALIGSLVLLIGASIVGIWLWRTAPAPTATFYPTLPTDLPPTPVPYNPPVYVVYPTPTPLLLPDNPAFVYSSMGSGQLGVLNSGQPLLIGALSGSEVAASPDGKIIAYLVQGRLRLWETDRVDREVTLPGEVLSMSWSTDGKALSAVSRSGGSETLYRVSADGGESFAQWTLPHFAAPPIWHPSTKRILIAETGDAAHTALYTIDADCGSQATCQSSRETFADLTFPITWMTFQYSGLAVVLADATGHLYTLHTALSKDGTRHVEPLLDNGAYKREPRFSPDGTKLLYLDGTNWVYMAELDNMAVYRVAPMDGSDFAVTSIDWMR